jgi:hypothetical protein
MKKLFKRFMKQHYTIVLLIISAVVLLSSSQEAKAVEQQKMPYLIKVNRVFNTITVYEKDDTGKYNVPIKAMLCSVGEKGTQTRLGTFQTKEKYRWKLLMGDVWGQFSTRIVGGILFHSVYYYQAGNPASLATREFNKLGSAASHGCIRLSVQDAKWIYDNCDIGTTVVIYDDKKTAGPLGKPAPIRIPTSLRWDPTDPSDKNPYKDKKPVITGVKNQKVTWGKDIDLLKGLKAKSSMGADITSEIKVTGEVDPYTPGDYTITYKVTDSLQRTAMKKVIVTVKETKELPKFNGVRDRIVANEVTVDEAFALEGVEVYYNGSLLKRDKLIVTIDEINENEYYITYQTTVSTSAKAVANATIVIDREAPVLTGIADRLLQEGEVPDVTTALLDVEVNDNYTDLFKEDILVTIEEDTEGNYLVTYEARDEAGNIANQQVRFYY